jgi:malate dehydrogenase
MFVLMPFSFAEKVLKAAAGEKGLVEPSYVYLPGVPGGEAIAKETGCDFFSVPIELGVSQLRTLPLSLPTCRK